MLEGVIFDIDGTLLDSNDAHAQSWVDTFAEAGYSVPFEVVRPLIGMGADKLLPKTIGIRHDSEEGKKLTERLSGIFRKSYLPHLRPLRGSRALVLRVREDGLKAIVATSAKDEQLKGLLKAAEVEDLMEEKATASDAKRSKPDPDIVDAAIEKSGVSPRNLVMIGDTPYDIEAATRAGVRIMIHNALFSWPQRILSPQCFNRGWIDNRATQGPQRSSEMLHDGAVRCHCPEGVWIHASLDAGIAEALSPRALLANFSARASWPLL